MSHIYWIMYRIETMMRKRISSSNNSSNSSNNSNNSNNNSNQCRIISNIDDNNSSETLKTDKTSRTTCTLITKDNNNHNNNNLTFNISLKYSDKVSLLTSKEAVTSNKIHNNSSNSNLTNNRIHFKWWARCSHKWDPNKADKLNSRGNNSSSSNSPSLTWVGIKVINNTDHRIT